jgi:PII-like signaling protein
VVSAFVGYADEHCSIKLNEKHRNFYRAIFSAAEKKIREEAAVFRAVSGFGKRY